jgi:hypothetical protein
MLLQRLDVIGIILVLIYFLYRKNQAFGNCYFKKKSDIPNALVEKGSFIPVGIENRSNLKGP